MSVSGTIQFMASVVIYTLCSLRLISNVMDVLFGVTLRDLVEFMLALRESRDDDDDGNAGGT